ncbi:MAG: hypothetical protein Q7T25_00340 [Sideroxyarcus sp.]|nr:hypothetical protein [Sideroxyarcus sp.]
MRAEVLKDLLAKLEECNASPEAKAEFRKMVLSVGTMHSVGSFEQVQRVDFARRLLGTGEPRAIVRTRLMSHFEVSESQAYRDIAAAL